MDNLMSMAIVKVVEQFQSTGDLGQLNEDLDLIILNDEPFDDAEKSIADLNGREKRKLVYFSKKFSKGQISEDEFNKKVEEIFQW